jgi:hypothetical protein
LAPGGGVIEPVVSGLSLPPKYESNWLDMLQPPAPSAKNRPAQAAAPRHRRKRPLPL